MTKIEQLESEINRKINELNESLNTQYLLRETLKNNTKTLGFVENRLKEIEANLKHTNEYIYTLKQENWRLKLSCDEWMRRAIKHKLEVLSSRHATKIEINR